MKEHKKISVDQLSTNEENPKQEKKRLSFRARIIIAVILIIVAITACVLGFLFQFKPSLLLGDRVAKVQVASAADNVALLSDGICRPNLLFNSDFSFNTRGYSEYSASGETIDNWNLWNGLGTYIVSTKTLNANLSAMYNAIFSQYLNPDIQPIEFGKTYTLTFKVNDKLVTRTASLPSTAPLEITDYLYINIDGKSYIRLRYDNRIPRFQIDIGITPTNSLKFEYVKLEQSASFTGWCPSCSDTTNHGYNPALGFNSMRDTYSVIDKNTNLDKFYINTSVYPDYSFCLSLEDKCVKKGQLSEIYTIILFNKPEALPNFYNGLYFQVIKIEETGLYEVKLIHLGDVLFSGYKRDIFGSYISGEWNLPKNTVCEVASRNLHYEIDLPNQTSYNGWGNWVAVSIPYEQGYQDGYMAGVAESDKSNQQLGDLIFGVVDSPIKVLRNAFNFEIFGINVSAMILFIITILCVGIVIKKLL